jgi:hypothetical protein
MASSVRLEKATEGGWSALQRCAEAPGVDA